MTGVLLTVFSRLRGHKHARSSVAAAAAALLLGSVAGHAATVKTEKILIEPLPAHSERVEGPQISTDGIGVAPDVPSGTAAEAPPEEEAPSSPSEVQLPAIQYGEEGLPRPVQRIRAQMLDAAVTGDIEQLRPILESNEVLPTLAFETFEDPIDYLKSSSGDGEGQEILAILSEVMTAGWVHVDVGTPQEMYIWPYFARMPLETLTPPQKVELFKIVTAGDYEEMKSYGAYIFYRVGIGPDGTWHYFVAGD